jgi:selenocysteine lyase/cysteine desulfurase
MRDLIYLDNAATTFPKPKEVHDFMHDFYQASGANPGRSSHDMALETERIANQTRKMLCELFNGTDKIFGTVRFSLGPFNTEEHIDKPIEAVQEIAAIQRH